MVIAAIPQSDDYSLMDERDVVFVIFPGFQPLDLAGPHEVFAGVAPALSRLGRTPAGYRLTVAASEAGPVSAESGLKVVADSALSEVAEADTLVVAGGMGVQEAAHDAALVADVGRLAAGSRRATSVCTGAFLLAATGLLDGRRVATHWARAARLAREFPAVEVDAEALFLQDGPVWTSAGVTAGIDLSLALVEEDHGADVAQLAARWLVMFLRRPGGQTQFSGPMWKAPIEHEPVRVACDAIHGAPDGDMSIAALAERVGLSERHFIRVFTREVGTSPARYVEAARIDAARRMLEATDIPVASVARSCGFGTTETLRRAFQRQVGVAPSDYRQRFRIPSEPGPLLPPVPNQPIEESA